MTTNHSFLLFAGSSHPELGKQIAEELKVPLGQVAIDTFPDREIGIEVLESVRGRDVFVLQTIARRPNHYLMEMLILVDALKRASARSIGFLVPYFGYSRQDRKDRGRVPITAKLVANLMQTAGLTRGLTMDLHAAQIQGFFDIPVDNLPARPVLIEAIRKEKIEDVVVVAPDLGSIKLARAYAEGLQADFAIMDKRRLDAEHVEPGALIGTVSGRNVLLVDDMVTTGETLKIAAQVCKRSGAKRIFAAVTHGVFAGQIFENSAIEKMFVTNTLPLPENFPVEKVEVVSVAPLFSRALESVLAAKSISSLYQKND
ncbi:MAG: Ribose-phosphate pyrophosphokinase [Chlamydiae bacterium]|nr:Ribose-phosphate pyrophosphokinase [Chlamydiota bacterium]